MRLKSFTWPTLMLLCMGVATWPVWRWYVLRVADGSDEPWGVLSLLTLLALMLRDRRLHLSEKQFLWPAALMTVYIISFGLLPPLGRAVIVTSGFGAILFRGAGASGLWGLLGLSLPIIATLQFYLGYPLRVLAAEASELTLRLCGYAVTRQGTLLHWAGETVMVDAPCSGIQMLWFGFYLAFLLAAFYRLNLWSTLLCACATFGIVVVANMVRATALFFKESQILSLPEWTHAGIGVALFGGSAWLIVGIIQKFQPKPCTA